MKSKIKELSVCIIRNCTYITGYKVDVLDDLPENILEQLKTDPHSDYLRPDQLQLLFKACGDTTSEGDTNFSHKFKWYNYVNGEKSMYYPNLAIDNVLALKYNVPITAVTDTAGMPEEYLAMWEKYIEDLQEYFYYNNQETTADAKNFEDFAFAISMEASFLPKYIQEIPRSQVIGFGDTSNTDDEDWRLEEIRERQAKEEAFKKEQEKNMNPLIPPPFEYDRHADYLVIPRDLKEINYLYVKYRLQALQIDFGVHMDANMVRQYSSTRRARFYQIKEDLRRRYGCKYLPDFSKRKCEEDHYAFQLCKYLGVSHMKYKRGNNLSFKKEHLEQFVEYYSDAYNKGEITKDQLDVLLMNEEAYRLKNIDLKLINEIFAGLSGVERNCHYHADRNLLQFHCIIGESETKRMTSQSPNIQGKTAEIKQMIKGRDKDRTVVAIDIKAQEVVILVFGVLKNKELQRLAMEYGDCYRAFAELVFQQLKSKENLTKETQDLLAGGYTKDLKNIIKVPILSIMNGKSRDFILKEVSYKDFDIVEAIFNIIYNDTGYKAIEKIANAESCKARPIRRGLFGTEVEATKGGKYGFDKGTKKRQSLNGNFQLTASEIVTTCLHAMLYDLYTQENKYGLSVEDVTIITTIYDEVLFDVDNKVLDQAIDLIKFYMLPMITGWDRMSGEITQGEYYVHK